MTLARAGRKFHMPKLRAAASLNASEKKLHELLSSEEPMPMDDIVERSCLNSSEVLATLFIWR